MCVGVTQMEITTSGTRAVFTDDLGAPLIGGKVYTYAIGTSTPKDTYKTALLITPHTNPIILDDAGSVALYLAGGYRLRVYDLNDVFIDEVDSLYQGDSGYGVMPEGAAYDYFKSALAAEARDRQAAQQQIQAEAQQVRLEGQQVLAEFRLLKTLILAGL